MNEKCSLDCHRIVFLDAHQIVYVSSVERHLHHEQPSHVFVMNLDPYRISDNLDIDRCILSKRSQGEQKS